MYFVNEFKYCLGRVKNKISKFRSDEELINLLENFRKDNDLLRVEELMKELDYSIAGMRSPLDDSPFRNLNSISYQHIFDDHPYYTMGIFFLPRNSLMPVHSHKNMLVFTKVLCGKTEIKSYDKLSNHDLTESIFEAKLTETAILKEGDLSVLSPKKKNLHEMRALENTAIFDILLPDYTLDNNCEYFKVHNENGKLIMKSHKYNL